MSAAEPHPHRRRALRRALAIAAASGVLALAAAPPASAQLIPTTTTEPATTTTAPEPVETTTTTEAEEAPVTTVRPTATTRATPTTARQSSDDGGTGVDEDAEVFEGAPLDEDDTVEGETPTETTSTARDLLVGGDGSDGAQSTTTTSTTVAEVAADEGTLDEQTQIWLIVAGLVVVAALIGLWTWRYWVRTKPVPVEPDADGTTVFRER